jgi:hypothetical protein
MVLQLNRCFGQMFRDESWRYGPLEQRFGDLKEVLKNQRKGYKKKKCKKGQRNGSHVGTESGIPMYSLFCGG